MEKREGPRKGPFARQGDGYMTRIFKDLCDVPWWGWLMLPLLIILLTLAGSGAYMARTTVWLVLAAFLALTLFLAPVILSSGKKGHKHVPAVCAWTIVWFLAAIGTFFYWYFRWMPGSERDSVERILNVVPVLTAIVAAGLGWYVHYQFSAKAQRTNSAFALVMEMQKSSEYIRRNEIVRDHFPPSLKEIPQEYVEFFPADSVKKARDEAASNSSVDPKRLERAEAIASLRYILNFYEFMAVGVRSNDLDCDLLVETVGQIVIGRFSRAEKFVHWIRSPTGQAQELAFEHLEVICREWSHRVEVQESEARQKRLQASR